MPRAPQQLEQAVLGAADRGARLRAGGWRGLPPQLEVLLAARPAETPRDALAARPGR